MILKGVFQVSIYARTDLALAKDLGHRIDRLRAKRGLSREELGREMGISQPTLRKFLDEGEGKLVYLFSALRALNALEETESFLVEPSFSPVMEIRKVLKRTSPAARSRAPGRSAPSSSANGNVSALRQALGKADADKKEDDQW